MISAMKTFLYDVCKLSALGLVMIFAFSAGVSTGSTIASLLFKLLGLV